MILNYRRNSELDCISFLAPPDSEDIKNLANLSGIWHIHDGQGGTYRHGPHIAFVGDIAEMEDFMCNLEVLGYTFVENEVYGWQ